MYASCFLRKGEGGRGILHMVYVNGGGGGGTHDPFPPSQSSHSFLVAPLRLVVVE